MTVKISSLSLLAIAAPSLAQHIRGWGFAESYTTSSDGLYNLTKYTAPVPGVGSTTISSTWSLEVDDTPSGVKQSVAGFGAAITDATVANFYDLPDDRLSALLEVLLTTNGDHGAGMHLFRHTIGGSDLSAGLYTYDDSSTPDINLARFGLTPNGTAMTHLIRDFNRVGGGIKLLGSVWSPPGWMKLNGVIDGNPNNNSLNDECAVQFADYFVKYVQAFAREGVTVDAITIQNEPLNSNPGYPTMYMPANQSTELIQNHVGPALRRAGLETEIWAYDHNTDRPDFPETVIAGAADYVNTVAWHCYAYPLNWTVLTAFKESHPGVTQYMTECWTSPFTSWNQVPDFVMGHVLP